MNTEKTQHTTAFDVAKYFLWRAQNENKSISNKKLQKLVYYAQAWHLALKDKPLFEDKIEAWIHGPAIASLYRKFKTFSYGPIMISVKESDLGTVESKDLLDQVWDAYSHYDAQYLEFLTHNEEPWIRARENTDAGEVSNNEIDHDVMKQYYRRRLDESHQSETE